MVDGSGCVGLGSNWGASVFFLFVIYKLNLDLTKWNHQHDNCSFLNSTPFFFQNIFTSLSPKTLRIMASPKFLVKNWRSQDLCWAPPQPSRRTAKLWHKNWAQKLVLKKKNGRLRCWLVGFSLGDGIFIIPRTYSIHLVDFDGKCGINVVLLGLLVFCFAGGYI